MKERLIAIIEIIGDSFESLSYGKNPLRTILISFGLLLIVIAIVYYLTKDFNTISL